MQDDAWEREVARRTSGEALGKVPLSPRQQQRERELREEAERLRKQRNIGH